jgi:ribosomal-protein-alanine N-acetyltransferase
MAIRVERARPGDIAAVAEIEQQSFSDPWSERAFRDVLDHARIYFACARPRDDGKGGGSPVLGYVVAWFASGEGEIANLAVAPAARNRGVGSILLDAALAEARRLGAEQIFLEVRSTNERARRLYDSRGFVEVGRRKNYYRRPIEDAVILRRTERVATP